jgi:hypothetical protein
VAGKDVVPRMGTGLVGRRLRALRRTEELMVAGPRGGENGSDERDVTHLHLAAGGGYPNEGGETNERVRAFTGRAYDTREKKTQKPIKIAARTCA